MLRTRELSGRETLPIFFTGEYRRFYVLSPPPRRSPPCSHRRSSFLVIVNIVILHLVIVNIVILHLGAPPPPCRSPTSSSLADPVVPPRPHRLFTTSTISSRVSSSEAIGLGVIGEELLYRLMQLSISYLLRVPPITCIVIGSRVIRVTGHSMHHYHVVQPGSFACDNPAYSTSRSHPPCDVSSTWVYLMTWE